MKAIETDASLQESEQKFTNHSARKTTVSKLKKANIERSDIIKVTGHRSVQSLDDYDEADVVEQRRLSLALSKRNYVEKNTVLASSNTTTGHPLAPTTMNLPVQATAGPSMAQSKENYFPPSLQVIIIFSIFPLIYPLRP